MKYAIGAEPRSYGNRAVGLDALSERHSMKAFCISLLASAALMRGGVAQASNGTVIGVGTDSCGTFIKAIDAMNNDGSTNRAGLTWQGKQWVELGVLVAGGAAIPAQAPLRSLIYVAAITCLRGAVPAR